MVNRSPLGAGALATTGFPIDRNFTAELLGFQSIIRNGYDAVASRDDAAQAMASFAIMGTSLSRLAQDLHNWSSTEYAFVELSDSFSVVSSIMPQKKNPTSLEYLRAVAGYLIGDLAALVTVMKSITFGYVWDVAYAPNNLVFDGADKCVLALTLLKGILSTLTVKRENMMLQVRDSFATMTELADTIVRERGLSFRVAHNIVARAVSELLERGRSPRDLTPAMLDIVAKGILNEPLHLSKRAFKEALNPVENVRVRAVLGGPAPAEVSHSLEQAADKVKADAEEVMALSQSDALAKERLLTLVKQARYNRNLIQRQETT